MYETRFCGAVAHTSDTICAARSRRRRDRRGDLCFGARPRIAGASRRRPGHLHESAGHGRANTGGADSADAARRGDASRTKQRERRHPDRQPRGQRSGVAGDHRRSSGCGRYADADADADNRLQHRYHGSSHGSDGGSDGAVEPERFGQGRQPWFRRSRLTAGHERGAGAVSDAGIAVSGHPGDEHTRSDDVYAQRGRRPCAGDEPDRNNCREPGSGRGDRPDTELRRGDAEHVDVELDLVR